MKRLIDKGINLMKKSGLRGAMIILIGIMTQRAKCKFFELVYRFVGALWRKLDKTKAWPDVEFFINNAPTNIWGGVGGDSYTGWIYQQGFFAALIKCFATNKSLTIFDFGCGYGKMAPISTFFTHPHGKYIGVDILKNYIDFCKRKYSRLPRVEFYLSKDFNPTYPNEREMNADKSVSYEEDWPVADESIDIVIAISVFTHLQEADAFGYMNKIHSILKPNGIAILTFHIVEEPKKQPRFTSKNKPHLIDLFNFHTPLPPSYNWFTSNPELPESAIAINRSGLNNLIQEKFKVELLIEGSTTGGYDPFFQDVVVLRKCREEGD